MKAYSFTAHPERGWSVVTPAGAIVVEPGQQVTIVVSETWDQAAEAIRASEAKARRDLTSGDK